jgi:nucleotide-binding universal stress UspA family protein
MTIARRILCAVELSDTSREAVRAASELATTSRAELEIVHLSEGRGGEEVIVAEGVRLRADLIVVAHHGSMAERVVRHAPCSVLVVSGPGGAGELRNLLCGIDFSAHARAAMRAAAAVASSRGGKLTLVHVLDTPWVPEGGVLIDAALLAETRIDADRELRRWIIEAAAVHHPVEGKIRTGTPAEVLLEVARDGKHDLIVVGTHGRTGIARALLGSVAERLVRHADRPVLVVKG